MTRRGWPRLKRLLPTVVRMELRRLGQGHIIRYYLSCGHWVDHIGRRDLRVGSHTRCEFCR